MPAYDDLNLFHDGTTIAQGATIAPVSTTRASGYAVLDLKKTGSKGLGVVMVLPAAVSADEITALVQHSDAEASGYTTVSSFPVAAAAGVYTTRFQSTKRYVRVHIVTGAGTGNVNPIIFILPWAFITV